jgi:O-antigen/teichoic acid export membrane protein
MNEAASPGGFTRIVVRGVGLAGGGWVFGQAINLGIYLVLARLATPTEFGQLTAGAILVSFGVLVAGSGMGAALIQRRDRIEEAANTALLATLTAGVGFSLLALAAAPLVALFFDSSEIGWVAAAASGWILLRSASAVPDALMQRRFSFLRRTVVEPLGIVAFGATSITLVAAGLGVWGLVIGSTVQHLTMLIAAWSLARWRPQPRLASLPLWREMLGYGRHVIAAEMIRRTGGQARKALVGGFIGTAQLGQYSYSQRIAQKPHGLIVNAAGFVLFPAFSRISHDAARLRAGFLRALRTVSAIGMPIGFVLLPLGIPLAVLVFGEQWRLAGEAAAAMCAYIGFRSVVSVSVETCKAAGPPRGIVRVNAVSAVLTLALVAAAIPLGLVAVGAAISAGTVVTALYALRVVGGVVDLPARRLLGELWPPFVAASVMAATTFALEHFLVDAESHGTALGLVLVGGELIFALGSYLAALRILAPETIGELAEILRSVRARLAKRRSKRADVGAAPS